MLTHFFSYSTFQLILISVFGAIITSALSYDDYSNAGGPPPPPPPQTDLSFNVNLDNLGSSAGYPNSNAGGYPDSNGGGGGGGYPSSNGGGYPNSNSGGYDYTPQNQHYEHQDHHEHHDHHDHHEHHEHHPEPPKGHWEKKLKWKEDWVSRSPFSCNIRYVMQQCSIQNETYKHHMR